MLLEGHLQTQEQDGATLVAKAIVAGDSQCHFRGDEVYKTIAIEITRLDVKAHAITIRQTKQRLRWGILKSSSGHSAIDKDGPSWYRYRLPAHQLLNR